jgi:hypothetical protein
MCPNARQQEEIDGGGGTFSQTATSDLSNNTAHPLKKKIKTLLCLQRGKSFFDPSALSGPTPHTD